MKYRCLRVTVTLKGRRSQQKRQKEKQDREASQKPMMTAEVRICHTESLVT